MKNTSGDLDDGYNVVSSTNKAHSNKKYTFRQPIDL